MPCHRSPCCLSDLEVLLVRLSVRVPDDNTDSVAGASGLPRDADLEMYAFGVAKRELPEHPQGAYNLSVTPPL